MNIKARLERLEEKAAAKAQQYTPTVIEIRFWDGDGTLDSTMTVKDGVTTHEKVSD